MEADVDQVETMASVQKKPRFVGPSPVFRLKRKVLMCFHLAQNSFRVWREEGFGPLVLKVMAWINRRLLKRSVWDWHPYSVLSHYYQTYVMQNQLTPAQREKLRAEVENFRNKPRFSIVVPVFNVERKWLMAMIDSVVEQVYPYWELCLADDASTDPSVRKSLEEAKARDSRIKVIFRPENGHISRATNSAMSLATGDYYVLMDNDDAIPPEALYEFAKKLNADPSLDMIYSDEDKIDIRGRRYEPFFKPDWSPEYLESAMYTAHLACYRKSIADQIGGFRIGYEGAQDYDFVLRFTEQTERIAHIPKVLYHWRAIPGSTAASMDEKNYVIDAAIRGLQDRLRRTGREGTVKMSRYAGCFDVRWKLKSQPLVSIVLPTGGFTATVRGKKIDLIHNCVAKITEQSTYRNVELVIVDNGDIDVRRKKEVERVAREMKVQWVTYREPSFNIAKKINLGAKYVQGDFILILNDDIEPISPDWIEAMLEQGQKAGVGVVGAKLLYANETTQHVGVTFCMSLPDHVSKHIGAHDPGYFFGPISTRNWMAVTGACMLTRTEIFRAVGGYTEDFAVNYNDIDFCLKVLGKNHRIVYTPHATMFHFESVSREATVAQSEIDKFLNRWRDRAGKDPYYNSQVFETRPPNYHLGPLFKSAKADIDAR